MRAVELLTNPDGSPAAGARQAGALMVLCFPPLEQLDPALALLETNWRSGGIAASAGVTIIERALSSPSGAMQEEAAAILFRHSDLLVSSDGRSCYWPEIGTQYPTCPRIRGTISSLRGWRCSPLGARATLWT
jgi:hypothetical protein